MQYTMAKTLSYIITQLSIALLLCSNGMSQSYELSKSVPLAADNLSTDRYGNIYVADRKGNVYKYDINGTQQSIFSPAKLADVSLLEAWNTVKIFIFYKDLQEYVLSDRFMSATPGYKFNMENVGFARMATLANDNNIWVIDDVDFSLKKVDGANGKILYTNPLQLVLPAAEYDISFMREYQNTLFIADANSGILVFDNLGNYRKKLFYKNVKHIGFSENYMYLVQNGKLVQFNLYTFEEKITELPDAEILQVTVFENKLIAITPKGLQIYKINP